MQNKLKQELKLGKKIKVKHPDYQFIINAELKLQDDQTQPSVSNLRISLPKKANRGEKLLLKLVEIYCYEVLQKNLLGDVLGSMEYRKVLSRLERS